MNIALSSLLIILLLIPAIIFRAFIIKSDGLENPLDTSLRVEIVFILIVATIIHIVGIILIPVVSSSDVNIYETYLIFSGFGESVSKDIINYSFVRFLIYIVICSAFSMISAIRFKVVYY